MKLKGDPQLDDEPHEFRQLYAQRLKCPSCGRAPGKPCSGMNGNRPAMDLNHVHSRRMLAARAQYRLDCARLAADPSIEIL